MVYILKWVSVDNHPIIRLFFKKLLWGYPDFITKVIEEVRPALVEEHEKRKESEKEEQPKTMVGLVDNVQQVQEDTEDNSVSAPPQFSPPVPFDNGSRPVVMIQTNAQPDNRTQPIDHPPASDERHLSTVIIESTEVLEPTSGSPGPAGHRRGASFA